LKALFNIMDPTSELRQPWKEWIDGDFAIQEEAESSPSLKKIQEERRSRFEAMSGSAPLRTHSPENKAG
jgi:hypothetical protein